MTRVAAVIAGVMAGVLFWHECGEDIGVFCYRIGMGAFTALRNREGLPHICLNDLRHFSATQVVAAGIDPRLIAGRLGHDASVLLRIYSHVIRAETRPPPNCSANS